MAGLGSPGGGRGSGRGGGRGAGRGSVLSSSAAAAYVGELGSEVDVGVLEMAGLGISGGGGGGGGTAVVTVGQRAAGLGEITVFEEGEAEAVAVVPAAAPTMMSREAREMIKAEGGLDLWKVWTGAEGGGRLRMGSPAVPMNRSISHAGEAREGSKPAAGSPRMLSSTFTLGLPPLPYIAFTSLPGLLLSRPPIVLPQPPPPPCIQTPVTPVPSPPHPPPRTVTTTTSWSCPAAT